MLVRILFCLFVTSTINADDNNIERETPIIGILSQENKIVKETYPHAHSVITASYVKFIESSGGRVIPVWIGQNEEYYERVVKYTNGILFPGGAANFNDDGGYGQAAKKLFDRAIKINNDGTYYPILGICLGMQVLAFSSNNGEDLRKDCEAESISIPLNFRENYTNSKLFSGANDKIIEQLATENITFNFHKFCLLESDLKNDWIVITTNKDLNGLEFVSTIESGKYPFFGIQYHPEKSMFEFQDPAVHHCKSSMDYAHYMTNFFVDQSRRNNHTFPNNDLEVSSLIYNYNPVYSVNTGYEQMYLFKQSDYRASQLK